MYAASRCEEAVVAIIEIQALGVKAEVPPGISSDLRDALLAPL